jgi:hypothetical protein
VTVTTRQLPSLKVAAAALVGSQFPDIIDRPLALELGLLPTGRVGVHSLPRGLALLYSWRTERV